jgi:hypothetical protein
VQRIVGERMSGRRVGRRVASRYAVVAAAGVAGVLVMTGCAQEQLGAAALYNPSQRISSSKLTAEAANLNSAYQKYSHKVQISYPQTDIPRQVLSWMLRFATGNRLAAQRGIVVTPAQAQQELSVETANVKQSGDTLIEAAVLNGLPPNMLSELGTWISIQVQLDKQLTKGVAPKTAAGSTALTARVNHLQCLAAKSLDIKINPQYGVYDYGQSVVIATPDTLSTTSPVPVATPTPTAPPQLTPPC